MTMTMIIMGLRANNYYQNRGTANALASYYNEYMNIINLYACVLSQYRSEGERPYPDCGKCEAISALYFGSLGLFVSPQQFLSRLFVVVVILGARRPSVREWCT